MDSTQDRPYRSRPPFSARVRDIAEGIVSGCRAWGASRYRELLVQYYKFLIPEGSRVLEIGSRSGDLLAALKPSYGVGLEYDEELTNIARLKHPQRNLVFVTCDFEEFGLGAQLFDYIILSDTVSRLRDILKTFEALKPYCHFRTRIILNFYSRLWQPILALLELLRLKAPQMICNWVTREDIKNLLQLGGFESVSSEERILLPVSIPVLSQIANKLLAPFAPFRWFCLTNWVVARLPMSLPKEFGVSIVCPCRNEAGNIRSIVERIPDFDCPWELIFVEGHSTDKTLEQCHKMKEEFTHEDISVFQQVGKGKGDAVRLGFANAKYEVLVILDADMTVPPEELPGFVSTLKKGRAEFINGSRLVYPMEEKAMRFLNLIGNKFFSIAFTFLLGQPIKDTLCGTKVLWKKDYERLSAQRSHFGEFDPFGDFDLLFGASKLSLKIMDFPIRYQARSYGTTQISRFTHGLLLFRMCGVALIKLKLR